MLRELTDDLVVLVHGGNRVRIETTRIGPALTLDQQRNHGSFQQRGELRFRGELLASPIEPLQRLLWLAKRLVQRDPVIE